MSKSRLFDLEVDVATMRQRVDALEQRIYGRVDDLSGPQPLFDLYAHLTLDGIKPTEEVAVLLRTCVAIMSPRLLLDLARMVNDPFPWRPFLAAMDLLSINGFDVADVTAHLERCIAALFKAQGLQVLRIEDVIRTTVGPVHSLKAFALSDGQGKHGQKRHI